MLEDGVENLTLTGTIYRGNGNELDNVITGNDADNNLWGMEGNDTLIGGGGADALFGDVGQDTLIGGAGDDYYEIDDAGDVIVENANEGDDFVRSTVSWTLGANLERLAVDGYDDLTVTGNALDNGLWGNLGNNTLTGGMGNDYLSGDKVTTSTSSTGATARTPSTPPTYWAPPTPCASVPESPTTTCWPSSTAPTCSSRSREPTTRSALANTTVARQRWMAQTADHKIDRIEFANGVVWDQAMIQTVVDRANNNHSPTVNSYLPTLQARGQYRPSAIPWRPTPSPIPDLGIPSPIASRCADGSALPAWLTFDANTRTLSGTPGVGNIGTLQFILWGTDNYNYAAGEYVDDDHRRHRTGRRCCPTALADQAAAQGAAFTYTVPASAFTDPEVAIR